MKGTSSGRLSKYFFILIDHLPYKSGLFSWARGRRTLGCDLRCIARVVQIPGYGIRCSTISQVFLIVSVTPSRRPEWEYCGRYYLQLNIKTSVPFVVLPSTSPANTRFTLDEKSKGWEIIRAHKKSGFSVPCGTSGK